VPKTIKFAIATLESLPLPEGDGRAVYYDEEVAGLQLRVSARGAKTFSVVRKVSGRAIRVTLGPYPAMTIDQARRRARVHIGEMVEGINPNAEKRSRRARGVKLSQVLEDYLAARSALKPRTREDYRAVFRRSFTAWANTPLTQLTREMVATRHRQLGDLSPAQANYAMRLLRALFNFARGEYENEQGQPVVADNPVTRLSHTRRWYRIERRTSILRPHQLPAWMKAVMALRTENPGEQAELARDYLLLVLFTGLRREEASRLAWANVDLAGRLINIPDTKNGTPHVLPLSDFLVSLLAYRKEQATGPYVFAGSGKHGYLVNPHKQIVRVRKASGLQFTIHDLRRTFITTAERLDISAYAVKHLANHLIRGDVTAGYVVMDVERLREPMQWITDALLSAAGIKTSCESASNVTRLDAS
jgi:integrase